MSRGWVIGVTSVLLATGVAAAKIAPAAVSWYRRDQVTAEQKQLSVSATVLVDFSRSFVPVRSGHSAGLLDIDQAGLRAVAHALADLAWSVPKMTVVWNRIAAGASAAPLCDPLAIDHSVFGKHKWTQREIEAALSTCVGLVARTSLELAALAPFTDISGAIATAFAETPGQTAERVLIILSDFNESLAPGRAAADFHLRGGHVLLLHRPGSDERDVSQYLSRIDAWKERLKRHGASTVATTPIFAASMNRVRAGIAVRPNRAEVPSTSSERTSLTMLVDLKTNVFRTAADGFPDPAPLIRLAHELAPNSELKGWPNPITAQWVAAKLVGSKLQAAPFIDFDPRDIIAKPGSLNKVSDFTMALEESAHRVARSGSSVQAADLTGTVALIASAEPPPGLQILLVVSDFVGATLQPAMSFRFNGNTRVVMVHTPTRDGADPNIEQSRLRDWASLMRSTGASSVCQLPLATWTPSELSACL